MHLPWVNFSLSVTYYDTLLLRKRESVYFLEIKDIVKEGKGRKRPSSSYGGHLDLESLLALSMPSVETLMIVSQDSVTLHSRYLG